MTWLLIGIFLKLFGLLGLAMEFLSVPVFILLLNPITALSMSFYIKKKSKRPMLYFSYFIIDIFVPVFGFFAIVIFFLLKPLYEKIYKDHLIDAYEIPLGEVNFDEYTEQKKVLISNKDENIEDELYQNYHIQPYLDVFEQDDLDLKLNAIEKLSRNISKDSVYILKRALDDKSYEVRYFSNNALDKIEKKMFSKLDLASENLKRFPQNYQNYNIRAQHYLDIFHLGILDSSLERFFLERGLYDFIFSLQLNQDQSALFLKVTQVYLELNNYEKVVEISTQALKNDLTDDDITKIKFYRAEANFYLKKFNEVAKDCKDIQKLSTSFELINTSTEWWGGTVG